MIEDYLKDFVGLSAILTGFDANVLAPKVDPLGSNSVAQQYLRLMFQRADNEIFQQTLAVFDALPANVPPPGNNANANDPWTWNKDPNFVLQMTEQVKEQILSDPDMGSMARRMVRLWYLATWYTTEPPTQDAMVVSMDAYEQGLAWRTFQAHPMGYSELDYGYWNVEPATAGTTPPLPPVTDPGAPVTPATDHAGPQRGGV